MKTTRCNAKKQLRERILHEVADYLEWKITDPGRTHLRTGDVEAFINEVADHIRDDEMTKERTISACT